MKLIQMADLHFSVKQEKLEETDRCCNFILDGLINSPPDLIALCGDTLDELDGAIRIDSDTARAAIAFVERAASICPVAIVTGTPSHDRNSPYLFRHLKTQHPVYVADKIEMVALVQDAMTGSYAFTQYPHDLPAMSSLVSVITFLPSPNKAHIIAAFGGESKQLTSLQAKEVLHDALAYIGEINAEVPAGIPKILIGHGTISGAQFSTGATATGEDLEYSVHDLNNTNASFKAMGHIHKFQIFPGNIVYSGSIGRMNFGEVEDKCAVAVEFAGSEVVSLNTIKTPAREFFLCECEWEGIEQLLSDVDRFAVEVNGCDVRFRYTIPEEERHKVNRVDIEQTFLNAGARMVKIECIIVPKVRARAEGINRLVTLREKILKWSSTVNIIVPERVLAISDTIEGKTVAELLPQKQEPEFEYGMVVGK